MAGPPPIFVKFNDKVAIYGDDFVFSDASNQAHNDEPLTGVKLRVGGAGGRGAIYGVIRSIQGVTASRNLEAHGALDGREISVTWPSDEVLVRVFGNYGTGWDGDIGGISFETNKGRVLGPYGGSYRGSPPAGEITGGGATFDFSAPPGQAITGFIGRKNPIALGKVGLENVVPKLLNLGVVYGPAGNLIINGDFEESGGEALTLFVSNHLKGWTAIGRNRIEVGAPSNYGVRGATGMKVVELDGYGQATGLDVWSDGFYQDVKTTAGKTYTLSVDLARREGTLVASNAVEIWWRGTRLTTVRPNSTSLVTYVFSVQGSGGKDRLEFRENVQSFHNDSAGGIIDNVTLR
jgi:hypothetical protein